MYKLLKGKKISNKKGNLIKYLGLSKFFKKKIIDFYFTDIKAKQLKGWKIKNRKTYLVIVNGVVTFKLKKNNKKIIKLKIFFINKNLLLINENVQFCFYNETNNNASILSLLDKKYE